MKSTLRSITLSLATLLLPPVLCAGEDNPWTFDVSLYGVAAGMSGEVAAKGVPVNVDVGFDDILENLNFGAMGTARLGYERWALSTDVIYMDLEASKNAFTVEAKQWLVQPALEYRVCRYFLAYVGARYNNLELEMTGPIGVNPSDTQDWWDPIVGARVSLPFGRCFSFDVSGDVGGFGAGSDLTWQSLPCFYWHFAKWGSLQAGYRFLYTDYETGSGSNRFKYDILTQGPQIGVAFHF